MKIIGKTDDPTPRLVVRGIFQIYETEGIPLDILIENLFINGMILDPVDFVRSAMLSGMKKDRAISKLGEALLDIHGKDYANIIIDRLNGEKYV